MKTNKVSITYEWLIKAINYHRGRGDLGGDGVADLSRLLSHNKGDISSILNNKADISSSFEKKFLKHFKYKGDEEFDFEDKYNELLNTLDKLQCEIDQLNKEIDLLKKEKYYLLDENIEFKSSIKSLKNELNKKAKANPTPKRQNA